MTTKKSNQSTQGHKTKKHFNTLAILPCEKLISTTNIQVLRPRLVLMGIESTSLQSKASESRISVFLKTKSPQD